MHSSTRPERLGAGSRLIGIEAVVLVALVGLAQSIVPFQRLARIVSRPLRHTKCADLRQIPDDGDYDLTGPVADVCRAMNFMLRCAPMRVTPFSRAIVAQAMLRRRGVDSTLFYGVSPVGEWPKPIDAHAWVQVRGTDIAINARGARYAVLATFPGGRFGPDPGQRHRQTKQMPDKANAGQMQVR